MNENASLKYPIITNENASPTNEQNYFAKLITNNEQKCFANISTKNERIQVSKIFHKNKLINYQN